jgi:hypothetical protein
MTQFVLAKAIELLEVREGHESLVHDVVAVESGKVGEEEEVSCLRSDAAFCPQPSEVGQVTEGLWAVQAFVSMSSSVRFVRRDT